MLCPFTCQLMLAKVPSDKDVGFSMKQRNPKFLQWCIGQKDRLRLAVLSRGYRFRLNVQKIPVQSYSKIYSFIMIKRVIYILPSSRLYISTYHKSTFTHITIYRGNLKQPIHLLHAFRMPSYQMTQNEQKHNNNHLLSVYIAVVLSGLFQVPHKQCPIVCRRPTTL